jgi:hypothetical protein
MYSETDIANLALGLLEEALITSYADDTGAVARLCRLHYPITRDTLLRAHPWNFAIARASLAADSAPPSSGWLYQYTLPADCVRLLPLQTEAQFNGYPRRHVVEGGKVLTDHEAPLKILYISRATNTALFDPLFVDALAKGLAARLASFVTGKQSYAERLMQMAQEALRVARTADGMEGTMEDPAADDWALARWGFDMTGTAYRNE